MLDHRLDRLSPIKRDWTCALGRFYAPAANFQCRAGGCNCKTVIPTPRIDPEIGASRAASQTEMGPALPHLGPAIDQWLRRSPLRPAHVVAYDISTVATFAPPVINAKSENTFSASPVRSNVARAPSTT